MYSVLHSAGAQWRLINVSLYYGLNCLSPPHKKKNNSYVETLNPNVYLETKPSRR